MATWDLDIHESDGIWHIIAEVHRYNKLWYKTIIYSTQKKEDAIILFGNLYQYMMLLEELNIVSEK